MQLLFQFFSENFKKFFTMQPKFLKPSSVRAADTRSSVS